MAKGADTHRCGNCRFFVPPREPDKGIDLTRDTGGIYTHGRCRRYPKTEAKFPHDWCGDHQVQPESKSDAR